MSFLFVGQFPREFLERRSIRLCRLIVSSRKVSVLPSVLVNHERTVRPLAVLILKQEQFGQISQDRSERLPGSRQTASLRN